MCEPRLRSGVAAPARPLRALPSGAERGLHCAEQCGDGSTGDGGGAAERASGWNTGWGANWEIVDRAENRLGVFFWAMRDETF